MQARKTLLIYYVLLFEINFSFKYKKLILIDKAFKITKRINSIIQNV
jgi:hypothetical protein